jgi:type I restriction enzyme, S subunit
MPEGWIDTTLGEVARWFSGGTPRAGTAAYYGGNIPWAVIADLKDRVVVSTATSITQIGLDVIGGRVAPVGAVLVSMYGTIGRVAAAGVPLATNQAIAWGVPTTDSISPEWLLLWLSSHQADLDQLGRGATQRNINREIIKAFPIAVPPRPEQRRIVDLIEAVDQLIERTTEEAKAAEVLATATLEHGIIGCSEVHPLGDLILSIEAGKSPPAEDRRPGPGELAVLKVSAVRPGYFDPIEVKVIASEAGFPAHSRVRRGDLLMTRANTRPLVGAVCTVDAQPTNLFLCDKTLRLNPDLSRVSADYLMLVLRSR